MNNAEENRPSPHHKIDVYSTPPQEDADTSTPREEIEDSPSSPFLYLTPPQTKTLLSKIDNPRDLAIITLMLHTGLFMRETTSLTLEDINWQNRTLKIQGKRERILSLSDQAHDTLASYTHARTDSQTNLLFTTERGHPRKLTDHAMHRLLKKYGRDAKLPFILNAQILRNTFGLHLAREETTISKLSYILGISDVPSIQRYIDAARTIQKEEANEKPPDIPSEDSRSFLVKLLSKIIPLRPRPSRVLPSQALISHSSSLIPPLQTFGRTGVLRDINANLTKGLSTLLVGDYGIGKTHLLKTIAEERHIPYIDSPTPIRQLIQELCNRFSPNWKERFEAQGGKKSRSTLREFADFLISEIKPPITLPSQKITQHTIIIDNLDRLRISDLDIVLILLDNFTILSAADDTPNRLKQLWWKFRRIDLKPLSDESAKEMIRALTSGITVVDRELLETRIFTQANGYPLAIVDLVNQMEGIPLVKKNHIRDLYHEAGMHYRSWAPAIMILWAFIILFRFIALGTHSFELYILAGFGMAMVGVARYFLLRVR